MPVPHPRPACAGSCLAGRTGRIPRCPRLLASYNSAMQAPVKIAQAHQEVDGSRIPELKSIVSESLKLARERGASQAEADVSLQKGLTTTVRLGEVETVEYQRDRGLGITVYFGKRKGSASTADLSPRAVAETV